MSGATATGWRVVVDGGPAADLHERSAAAVARPVGRTLRHLVPDRSAVVLGSAQRTELVRAGALASAGYDLVRRRSGGTAVLVGPGECRWVDLIVPVGDPLWEADVHRGAAWVGRAWVRALADVGVDAIAHDGPVRRDRWSSLVCFAGLAPGEVTVGGAKVVGVAQRRTRFATLLQCAVLERWAPADLLAVLVDPAEVAAAADELRPLAVGLGPLAAAAVERFVALLP